MKELEALSDGRGEDEDKISEKIEEEDKEDGFRIGSSKTRRKDPEKTEIINKDPSKVLVGHKKAIRDIAYSEK